MSHRKLAIWGAVTAAVGLVISVLSTDYTMMVIGRVITGAGSGFAISGANEAIAAREDAERIFALIWTMGGGITASLSINLPAVVEGGQYPMGFGVLLFLCLAGLPFMIWVPPRPLECDSADLADAGRVDSAQVSSSSTPPPRSVNESPFGSLALMALLGIFLDSLAEQALWNFSYTLPAEAGIDEGLVSWVLGFTTMMGLAGGAFAAWLGVRVGRIVPLVAGGPTGTRCTRRNRNRCARPGLVVRRVSEIAIRSLQMFAQSTRRTGVASRFGFEDVVSSIGIDCLWVDCHWVDCLWIVLR